MSQMLALEAIIYALHASVERPVALWLSISSLNFACLAAPSAQFSMLFFHTYVQFQIHLHQEEPFCWIDFIIFLLAAEDWRELGFQVARCQWLLLTRLTIWHGKASRRLSLTTPANGVMPFALMPKYDPPVLQDLPGWSTWRRAQWTLWILILPTGQGEYSVSRRSRTWVGDKSGKPMK